MTPTDVLLVGAGPIGLELGVCFKLMGVDYTHVEAGQIGQTISWYPRELKFFSSPDRIAIGGVPLTTSDQSKASREEYLAYLRGVVSQYQLDIQTFERVQSIKHDEAKSEFTVVTHRGGTESTYLAKRVVLAIGDMHRPRLLHIPGEDLDSVSHYFDEPHIYFRKQLMIVGGKNGAIEAAIRCHRAGAEVSISYRKENFDPKVVKHWLLSELKAIIRREQIRFYPCTQPVRITTKHVVLQPVGGGEQVEVANDFTLLMTGYEMDPTLFEMAGVQLLGEQHTPVIDVDTMETNVPGLFIAGTAAAGTQTQFRLFIENCHPHVTRIVRAITGQDPPEGRVNMLSDRYEEPEA